MKGLACSLFLFGNSPSTRDIKECKESFSLGDYVKLVYILLPLTS